MQILSYANATIKLAKHIMQSSLVSRFKLGFRGQNGGSSLNSADRIFLVLLLFLGLCVNSYPKASNLEDFKHNLVSDEPIKILQFTEIDCRSGDQRHFYGAANSEGFFLREYDPTTEDPRLPISPNNVPRNPDFYGQHGDMLWEIDAALEINEAFSGDPVRNYCHLGAAESKALISKIRHFGLTGTLFSPSKVIWNETNSNEFSATLNPNVGAKRNGLRVTEVHGNIVVSNNLVCFLRTDFGQRIHYVYSDDNRVPAGVPTEIIIGNSESDCSKIYLLSQLEYGDGVLTNLFDPKNQFASLSNVTVVEITNGVRRVTATAQDPLVPRSEMESHVTNRGAKNAFRILGLGCALTLPLAFFYAFRSQNKMKK